MSAWKTDVKLVMAGALNYCDDYTRQLQTKPAKNGSKYWTGLQGKISTRCSRMP